MQTFHRAGVTSPAVAESLERRTLFAAYGALDPSFIAGTNTYGMALTNAVFQPVDSAVQGDGRVLVAGIGSDGKSPLVERFQSDGSPDRAFGQLGISKSRPRKSTVSRENATSIGRISS